MWGKRSMADNVEIDVKVDVDDGNLKGLKFKDMGDEGESAFNGLDQASREWLNDFTPLINQAQTQMRTGWDSSKSAIENLRNLVKTGLGTSFDSLKTKISGVGTTIKSKLGGALTSLKSKAAGVMNEIKTGATSAGNGLGFLSSAASMAVGMVGFELFNGLVQSSRESINAAGKMQAFGKRLGMTSQEMNKFAQECNGLQSQFRKVDMRAVGASAEELGVKLNIPKGQMGDLTRMTAVMSSAFVNEGRTQEDAILAVSDAMDGQFRRLQELGITEDKLKANGWNGNIEDTNSLMQALNKTMDQMGFTETAQGIYSLDDAYQALTVAGGKLLADVLIPLTPYITSAVDAIIKGIDGVKKVIGDLVNLWNSLPDWSKIALGIGAIALAVGGLVGFIGEAGILAVPLIGTVISSLGTLVGIIGAISWPVVAVVAAIGLLIVGFEQLGEWLGWWTDFGSMLESIKSGVIRLWDAFRNSRLVQFWIQNLQTAFGVLYSIGKMVIDWIGTKLTEIFGTGGGNPDAIQTIIDIFTVLETVVLTTISTIGTWCSMLISFLEPVTTPIMNILQAWFMVQTGQISIFEGIMTALQGLVDFHQGLVEIVFTILITALSMLGQLIQTGLTAVINIVTGWISGLVGKAKTAASNFVNSLINGLTSLPSKFSNALQSVITAVSNWGTGLLNKANEIINQFKQTIENGVNQVKSWVGLGVNYEGVGYSGFNSGGTLNNTLSNTVNNGGFTSMTVNNYMDGIMSPEHAADTIVGSLNDYTKKQNLIRGVK